MKLNWKIVAALAVAQLSFAAVAADDAEIAALKKMVQDLDTKVRILEHQQDNAVAAAKTAPKISLGANGFNFSSSDSNFVAQFHGLMQFDNRAFFDDGGVKGNDGFLLRKMRPIFSGTVFHDFDFYFLSEFGGSSVQAVDAYVNYRYQPGLQFQVGKFKSPVGLEMLQGDGNVLLNERSIATDLIPNRDLGVMLKGDVFGGRASYALGLLDGASDFSGTTFNSSFQDSPAVAGRVFFTPWKKSETKALKGLGFGVGGSYQTEHPLTNSASGVTGGYTTDGQQKFFSYKSGTYADGAHWRLSPQMYYYYGPLGILAEYVISDQTVRNGTNSAELQNTAWNVTASWLLTGEEASYGAVTPKKPFDPRKGQWGAWQLVGRISGLDVDGAAFKGKRYADNTKSASGATAFSAGINWYLNKNIRANLSYSHTEFDGYTGTATGVGKQSENVLFTRLQLAF